MKLVLRDDGFTEAFGEPADVAAFYLVLRKNKAARLAAEVQPDLVLDQGDKVLIAQVKTSEAIDPRWLTLWERLHDKVPQRQVLEYLKVHPAWISPKDLASTLGVEGGAITISGTIGGLRKHAKRLYGDEEALLTRHRGLYKAGPELQRNEIPETIWAKNRFEKILGGNKKLGLDEDLSNADPEAP